MNEIKVNHILMLESFFEYINDYHHCDINLEEKYPYSISMEKRMFSNVRFSKNCDIFIRTSLPYTIQKLKNGNYIFLNREYKPLGIFGKSWSHFFVDYEHFKFLSFKYKDNIDNIYFYNEGNRLQDNKKDFIEYLIRLKYFLIDYKNNEIVLKKNYYRNTNIMINYNKKIDKFKNFK